LAVLPLALSARVGLHLFAGELKTAASLIGEIASVTEATGSGYPPYGALALAAFKGRDAEAGALIRAVEPELVPRGDGMGLTLVEHAKAVLYNGLGRYREAARAAERGAAHPQELGFSNWSLSQLVEAAVRSEEPALARDAVRRLVRTTQASGTEWAKGVEARCRALVSSRGAAEDCYREAIDHLRRTRVRGELARAHLLYGEWLRREGRRVDARDQLRTAHGMFTEMGMEAFADRARRERLATGETVRKRRDSAQDELTPQETQIALMARAGLTNAEIGGQLFLSPRTVEWHLKKIFAKLGINSRRGLQEALHSAGREATIA
jgi:DNA-binding CsgD family transcriptional regulator